MEQAQVYTVEMEITDWFEQASALAWTGYQPTRNAIDVQTAADGRCGCCGRALTYSGWKMPGTYRAFAVCVPCNAATEF